MRVVLVDPSLYTAPYDAGLTAGLLAAGVDPTWATRPVRAGDREELPRERTDAFFYRRVESAAWMPERLRPLAKGWAHLAGSSRLVWKVRSLRPDVVHLQWLVVPPVDAAAMALMRRWCPLVLTVHDTVPYNGERTAWMQRTGLGLAVRLAHRVIVHTEAGRRALAQAGMPAARIHVIPHGPLAITAAAPPPRAARDRRWTLVLFGEIKPYKGLDVLVEAVGALPGELRRRLRVVVAGRPRMDMGAVRARIGALGLEGQFELRLGRLTEEEMASLFAEADGFVFPYRQVDASGVYYLVKPLGKWLIASQVGVFAEDMAPGQGALVPSGDSGALAQALAYAIGVRPQGMPGGGGPGWAAIGLATRALYERVRQEFR